MVQQKRSDATKENELRKIGFVKTKISIKYKDQNFYK
jgi:hypothetical protein